VKTDTRECCIATINCDDYCICPFPSLEEEAGDAAIPNLVF
jgi:hypothetical protein